MVGVIESVAYPSGGPSQGFLIQKRTDGRLRYFREKGWESFSSATALNRHCKEKGGAEKKIEKVLLELSPKRLLLV